MSSALFLQHACNDLHLSGNSHTQQPSAISPTNILPLHLQLVLGALRLATSVAQGDYVQPSPSAPLVCKSSMIAHSIAMHFQVLESSIIVIIWIIWLWGHLNGVTVQKISGDGSRTSCSWGTEMFFNSIHLTTPKHRASKPVESNETRKQWRPVQPPFP